jgi:putative addiction module killer protein
VSELRLFFGAGYRVYFGEKDNQIVVLLCGGDKSTQSKDIEQAKAYWKEYLNHENL